MNKLVIGLTGGIGSGKSTIAKLFSAKQIVVVDADQCSRTVVEPGTEALKKIVDHFGPHLLLPDGSLDRACLRHIIFNHPQEKRWLEALLHPLIFQEIIHRLETAPSPYAILESPLLIEAGQSQICHRVLVVDVTEEQQIERAMKRDNNPRALIQAIMASQASRSDRLTKANDVLDNSNADMEKAQQQVEALHLKYLALSRELPP